MTALLVLIEEHTSPLEYDWRTRFSLPLRSIGREVTWREAWSLTTILLRDPSSYTHASVNEWDFPVTREAMVAMDAHDLAHTIALQGKRLRQPYPRPWPDPRKTRIGRPKVPQAEVRAALAARHPRLAQQLTGQPPDE